MAGIPYESLSQRGKLIARLHRATKRTKVDWREAADDNFNVSFPTYSLQIGATPGQTYEAMDYVIRLYNDEGRLVDEFSDVDVQAENPDLGAYLRMKETFEMARRHALGIDNIMNDILTQLEAIDTGTLAMEVRDEDNPF